MKYKKQVTKTIPKAKACFPAREKPLPCRSVFLFTFSTAKLLFIYNLVMKPSPQLNKNLFPHNSFDIIIIPTTKWSSIIAEIMHS